MPGTIQVSVVEFQSSSSLSPPSAMSLKVSIGKRDYQTWDKGDFSFPLTTLRDNLVVTLQDADGNKIAHTGVRTMSIVEKGSWDDIFAFEEGGHVRMKLQFILSEDDRKKIRTMRESALKKKQNTKTTNLIESSSIRADEKVSDSEMGIVPNVLTAEDVAMQSGPLLDPVPGSDFQLGTMKKEKIPYRDTFPDATDRSEGASPAPKQLGTEVPLETGLPQASVQSKPLSGPEGSSKMQHSGSENPSKRNPIFPKLEDDSLDKSKRRVSVSKIPRNVKKMISAFETNPDQDPRSTKKAPVLKSQGEDVGEADRESNSKGIEIPFLMKKPLQESEGKYVDTKNISNAERQEFNTKEEVNSPLDVTIPSTSETTPSSKKKHEETSEINMMIPSTSEKLEEHSEINMMIPSTSEKHKEDSRINSEVALNETSNSVACFDEKNNSFGNLDLWIFPNNNRHLCITTAGEEVIDLLSQTEAKAHPESECSSTPENEKMGSFSHGETKNKKDQSFFHKLLKYRSESSPDDAPNGLVGQVIKIGIVVGFGVLVLLTRQREPRKSGKKEAKDHFFTTQDYMDEQISEETMDQIKYL